MADKNADELTEKWATMPEAPIECRNRERTSSSPSEASNCLLMQEWDRDVCARCPKWISNVIHDNFIDGMNGVRLKEEGDK